MDGDILFDVLSSLPTKYLLGLKSVSKGWRRLISDRTFIQVQSQKREPISGFFVQQRYQYCDDDIKTISYVPVEIKGAELPQRVFAFLPEDVVVMASCNGLLCCRGCCPFQAPAAIYVCNPLNKEWVRVDWAEPDRQTSIALVFDPSQDFSENSTKFKVVTLQQYETDMNEFYFFFEIYSSETRVWKKSQGTCHCNHILHKNKGIFIGGTLHWLTNGDAILTFNVELELSWLIPVPVPAAEFKSVPQVCIGESEGKLNYIMVSDEGFHVWVLEDYFEFKWTLELSKTLEMMEEEHPDILFNLHGKVTMTQKPPFDPWMDPLGFKDGFLLMRVASNIFLHHIETTTMELVSGISKFGTNSLFCPTVLPYSMSLVSLN